jgi:hypothetical protein
MSVGEAGGAVAGAAVAGVAVGAGAAACAFANTAPATISAAAIAPAANRARFRDTILPIGGLHPIQLRLIWITPSSTPIAMMRKTPMPDFSDPKKNTPVG